MRPAASVARLFDELPAKRQNNWVPRLEKTGCGMLAPDQGVVRVQINEGDA